MNLYEIDSAILDCVDVETGEIFDEGLFEALEMERDRKIENICLWIKNLKSEVEALEAEKDAFDKRKKAAENKMKSLKKYISGYLAGTPFESTRVKVSFRASEQLVIEDDADIPDGYISKVDVTYDKAALKKEIKAGKHFDGVSIVKNQNIQIR